MKIAVIGAGALGSLYAGLLALNGGAEQAEIWLVGGPSSREHLNAIEREGLRLELAPQVAATWPAAHRYPTDPDGSYRVTSLKPVESAALVDRPVELALVLVKSYRTASAAEQAATVLGEGGLALTLQNGLGNAEQLAAVLGSERVGQGVTSLGATLLGPGRVRLAGLGQTALGLAPGLSPFAQETLTTFADRLRGLDLDIILGPDVSGLVWTKLVVNCAINPLTALLGCTNGELLERPATRDLLDSAAIEAAQIAQAAQIDLGYPPQEAAARARRVAELTSANLSSMLTDVRRGRSTEIEAINGAVVRTAERLGLTAPINRTLYLLVKAIGERQK